jgi:MFS family permease
MRRSHDAAAAVAAALVLVVGMGIGRFAFTGLYPAMVGEGHLSVSGGSYAASANYAGYLAGALLAGALTRFSSLRVCSAALVATVVTTGALALPLGETFVIVLRGLGGIASALAMVAASHWLIHDRQHPGGAPALFSGVGVGIMLSAELIAGGRALSLQSGWIWLLLAAVSVILAGVSSILAVRLPKPVPTAPSTAEASGGELLPAGRLILIYGLAGFGYIITATYLPLLVRSALGSVDPVHVWAVFGLGAIPSCFLWHALHVRWGTRLSLVANLAVQALGVALPALSHSAPAYLVSALLVGGTFMGTVTIAMPAARRVGHTVRFNMLAIMTASYGVGQIVGPLAASALFARFGSFDPSLLLAAAALVLACLCAAMRASNVTPAVLASQRSREGEGTIPSRSSS